MSLNSTPSAERIHIGFFGMRNAGKSSLVNAVTGQELSVVSDLKGTTTDPVKKALEILPLGPVVVIDTPGLDDEGELGEKRVKKAEETLAMSDIAVLVCDADIGLSVMDKEIIQSFKDRKLPYLIVYNKSDLLDGELTPANADEMYVSARTGQNINALKERLGTFAQDLKNDKKLVADLLTPGDTVVLVIPIDESAPKGRLILPQQQVMRDVLDTHCKFIACQDTELKETLEALSVKPRMVITDSQAFGKVSKDTPDDILLTSFSILFGRYKGNLETLVKGAAYLSKLKHGDRVLISEGCTHHRQCNDIGTVKMPGWIEKFSGARPVYDYSSGNGFPDDLSKYKLIVHCGGCMINEKEMQHRLRLAKEAGVPIVNYGIAIAHMHGILHRSLEVFPDIQKLL